MSDKRKNSVIVNQESPRDLHETVCDRLMYEILVRAIKDVTHSSPNVRREVQWWFSQWDYPPKGETGFTFRDVAEHLELGYPVLVKILQYVKDNNIDESSQ